MTAQSIRDFFHILFGSRRIEDLKEQLAKTEQERDYFRGKADRLEVLLTAPRTVAPTERRPPILKAVRPHTWEQVRAEWNAAQAAIAKQEAEDKKRASGGG
jgi:hypothetical protein